VDARVLGGEREDGERVRVLSADQRARGPEVGLERAERVAVAAGVDQPLADGRHKLLVLADELAPRPDEDLAVEERAEGVRQLLARPHDHVRTGLRGGALQLLDLGPGNLDRVLEQLDAERGRDAAVPGWKWNHTGWAGMKPSGKPTICAPLRPASRISAHAFAVLASRSRNTDAA
jgi:hypothetical protein